MLAAPKGSHGFNLSTKCAKTELFLPFGSGSRACVGQKFVILAIALSIASLLRNYEVRCDKSYGYILSRYVAICLLVSIHMSLGLLN
jgi:hypothetical protein